MGGLRRIPVTWDSVELSERAARVAGILAEVFPDAECELDYRSPWELLVATVLSAQCTDKRVNLVTPVLFGLWPGPSELAAAAQSEVQEVIRTTGFFRNKAKAIRITARMVATEHGGEVPADLDALIALPGVGRKTAKVVLGEAFGIPAGIAVDTHVRRVSQRLGLSTQQDPEKIAADLESLLPRSEWVKFSLRVILHGRRVCSARKPDCDRCGLVDCCDWVRL